MTDARHSQQAPLGGGCLIAAGLLLGAVVGVLVHQPSIGVVAGFAIGVVAAVVLTVRRR